MKTGRYCSMPCGRGSSWRGECYVLRLLYSYMARGAAEKKRS
jgi:hypothetical protein